MIRFCTKDSCSDKEHASSSFTAEVSDNSASASKVVSDGSATASGDSATASETAPNGAAPSSEAASETATFSASSSAASSSSSAQALEYPGRFKHVVTSRSGSLSLYEDGDGHLVVIDPQRFC